MPNFAQLSPTVNFAVFGVAAAGVWAFGARTSQYANRISERRGIHHVLIGLLLVASLTSPPVSATAALLCIVLTAFLLAGLVERGTEPFCARVWIRLPCLPSTPEA